MLRVRKEETVSLVASLRRTVPFVSKKAYAAQQEQIEQLSRLINSTATGIADDLIARDQTHFEYFTERLCRLERCFGDLHQKILDLQNRCTTLQCSILEQRAVFAEVSQPSPPSARVSLQPIDPDYTLQRCFDRMRKMAPKAFEIWKAALDASIEEYSDSIDQNCSVTGHFGAKLFRLFLRPYLTGTVLDIGCGPQPMPFYLEGHPPELVAGLDPLPPHQPHPFAFAQGVGEYLPWHDDTFDVVVVATSLDHVLFLDVALKEIKRVLKPNGTFVTWVGFVQGAAPYNPYSAKIEAIDDHHLFHFDKPWFEDLMEEYFTLKECHDVDGSSYFWSFATKH